jgi:starch synthase
VHILMVAAENGALPGGKVGGIADVIREVPPALAALGQQVTVLTPGYQSLSQVAGAVLLHTLTVEFGGALEALALFEIRRPNAMAGVRHLVLEHPLFAACGVGSIYCHDAFEPFATDASKFALFSLAACHVALTGAAGTVDVLHLHDWHAALVLLLCRYHRSYQSLQSRKTVFTIHNLSLQGIRPFAGSSSSPAHWFPQLQFPRAAVLDPRYPECINLMRLGINFADQVHVVSPRYAAEILLPSHPELGLVRGEGLEADLGRLATAGRLHGILNGCEYPPAGAAAARPLSRRGFFERVLETLQNWAAPRQQVPASWLHAALRVQQWRQQRQRESLVLASIGRLTSQKVSLLQVRCPDGRSVLDHLLEQLQQAGDGCLIMLGSGEPECERFMTAAMQRHANLLFLCGYSDALGEALYEYCDAFLMPSSFEPCGISQLVAMRAGKPVLVHATGGLADTVQPGFNGFSFEGATADEQGQRLLATFAELVHTHKARRSDWQRLCRNAAATRFTWDRTVRHYLQRLYGASVNE